MAYTKNKTKRNNKRKTSSMDTERMDKTRPQIRRNHVPGRSDDPNGKGAFEILIPKRKCNKTTMETTYVEQYDGDKKREKRGNMWLCPGKH